MIKFSSLLTALVTGVELFFFSVSAQAISLQFVPDNTEIFVGDSFDVSLEILDLGDAEAPSLGTFDLNVNFDSSLLQFQSASFGDPDLGDQLDLFGLGVDSSFDNTINGILNLYELSCDSVDDLNSLQASEFILATLSFSAIGTGTSSLTINNINIVLGDALGDPLAVNLSPASITINPAPVPEPATMLLFSTGLMGLVGLHRKKKIMSAHIDHEIVDFPARKIC